MQDYIIHNNNMKNSTMYKFKLKTPGIGCGRAEGISFKDFTIKLQKNKKAILMV